ncbi:hypothetical protein COT48_04420 [Candidatus Woesearchaeota archaeon CG08_land_8_20_14_0_20_47_9]|nr:MAG: hypothetical protein AUJ69_03685 [Candidatus Woesearchaeota archaeon CG1_02_47_18]PIO03553.1 MAG: hypothetical protein COT48_04420 [Candidatus Woesearchaeota archaeon CG08_land_8_20_14_0_20_47_9]HII29545.1 hypothetical protein [Candidatus Woesearchaeota archaeon]
MANVSTLTTGVDRLVSLIERKRRISIPDAAKELSIPRVVVEEWAAFLEEKNIISIQYRLTTPFLVKREITKEEAGKQAAEFESKKEGFIRKVESALNRIERETGGLKGFKEEFSSISREIDQDLKNVENDLKELEKYESLKKNIDCELTAQQDAIKSQVAIIEKELLDKKHDYEQLDFHIREEESRIGDELSRAEETKNAHEVINQRIEKLRSALENMSVRLQSSDEAIKHSEEELSKYRDMAARLERAIASQDSKIIPLMKQSKQHEERILKDQEALLKKVSEYRLKITGEANDAKKARDLFEKYLHHKMNLDVTVDKIDMDLDKLKGELRSLMEEARVMNIAVGRDSFEKSMGKLESRMKGVESKKKGFDEEVMKLKNLISK